MKKSLQFPFTLLILLSILTLTLLSVRTAILPAIGSGSGSLPGPEPVILNSTIISLASADPTEPDLRREVDALLDGNLPSSSRARHRTISTADDHYHADLRARSAIRFRLRRDYRVFPHFRRLLRDWIRRRRFDPGVVASPELLLPLPPPSPSSRRYDSCAVVGNSGILLSSDRGALIDSHDLVVRLNNARTAGYSRHVGSRTNLSFVNSNILHLCARRPGCFCHPYGDHVPILMYICQPAHLLDYSVCNASHKAPLLVTDPSFDLLCARIVRYYSIKRFAEGTGKPPEQWAKLRDEKAFHYSSGMQAVVLAVGACRRVSVFGFGKAAEAKHHYHTNQKAELSLHDYEAEYEFYRDLVERPEVIPFLRDSGLKVPPVVFYH